MKKYQHLLSTQKWDKQSYNHAEWLVNHCNTLNGLNMLPDSYDGQIDKQTLADNIEIVKLFKANYPEYVV